LLDDMVPIRDLIRILEAVTARARDTRDREQLVEAARQVLAAAISAQAAPEGVLAAITIEPSLEHQLIQARRIGESGSFLDLDASRMEQLIRATADAVVAGQHRERRVALICSPQLRPVMQRLVGRGAHCPPVLSYSELVPTVVVEPVEVIDLAYASQEL